MDNRWRKPLPENTEKLENQVAKNDERIAELHELQAIKESTWWRIRERKLTEKLSAVEDALMDFDQMTEKLMLLNLAEWKMLRTELTTPADIEVEIARLEKSNAELKAQISERKQRERVSA